MGLALRVIECPECDGIGEYVEEVIDYWARREYCGWCDGKGKMTPWRWLQWWKWEGRHHGRTR